LAESIPEHLVTELMGERGRFYYAARFGSPLRAGRLPAAFVVIGRCRLPY
jgi:hypothetical protein